MPPAAANSAASIGWPSRRGARHDAGRARRGDSSDVNAELAVVALGPVVFVTVNAEVFSRFNELIATDDGRRVYAIGCTNGMLGYLPTSAAYDEGGYEIQWSMLFYNRVRPKPGSLELLAEHARRLVLTG